MRDPKKKILFAFMKERSTCKTYTYVGDTIKVVFKKWSVHLWAKFKYLGSGPSDICCELY
jgi:hypothetical protein